MPDPNVIGAATLSMTQSLSLFGNFLPHFSELSKADPVNNPEIVRDVRMGEFAAVMMTLGIGAMTSSLVGSSTPAVVACITAGGLVLIYEYALRSKEVSNAE